MWCFVVRSAQGARILNPLMLLATPRMRTSARADFPLMLSTSSSTKQSPSYNFNQTLLPYPLHTQLPYHPHTSNLHYHPRTWAEHQLPFGGSCARARSSQPFVWKSFLLMAIWDHRRYSREEFLNVWCLCLKWSSIFVLRLLSNSSGEKDIGFSLRGWIWSVFVSFFHSFVVCV